MNLWRIPYIAMDATSVTLSDMNTSVELGYVSAAALATIGPPIEAVVVSDGTHPSSGRVTVKCECRCGRVLARYTGGLRLTAAHPAKRDVRFADGMFVFECRNPGCKVPAKLWSYDRLATVLRDAWDQKRRRFVVT